MINAIIDVLYLNSISSFQHEWRVSPRNAKQLPKCTPPTPLFSTVSMKQITLQSLHSPPKTNPSFSPPKQPIQQTPLNPSCASSDPPRSIGEWRLDYQRLISSLSFLTHIHSSLFNTTLANEGYACFQPC